jgi:hypothetical protein
MIPDEPLMNNEPARATGKTVGMTNEEQAQMHREIRVRQDAAKKKSQESLADRLSYLEDALKHNRGEWPMQASIFGTRTNGGKGRGDETQRLLETGCVNGKPAFWYGAVFTQPIIIPDP